MKNFKEHIHTWDDGRGARDIFLNGKLIDRVVLADTKRGLVRLVHDPVRIDHHKKRALTYTLRGEVKVVMRKVGS